MLPNPKDKRQDVDDIPCFMCLKAVQASLFTCQLPCEPCCMPKPCSYVTTSLPSLTKYCERALQGTSAKSPSHTGCLH